MSRAMAVSASTSGYLDTPAKYRDMAPSHNSQEDDIEEMEAGEYHHVFPVRIKEVVLCITFGSSYMQLAWRKHVLAFWF